MLRLIAPIVLALEWRHPRRGVGAMQGSFGSFAIADCSECAGLNVPLTFGVIGAGAGIAIGAGLDALHSKKGVMTERPRRVQVSPVIARDKRGVIASLQF